MIEHESQDQDWRTEAERLWDEQAAIPLIITPLKPPTDTDFPLAERIPRQLGFKVVDDHSNFGLPSDHPKYQIAEAATYLWEATPNAFPDGPIEDYQGSGKTQGFKLGQVGDVLDDRSRQPDGYRFHDVLHGALAAVTGWSATQRALLNIRRRSDPTTYAVDDGPRAILAEESMFSNVKMSQLPGNGLIIPDTYLLMIAMENHIDFRKYMPPDTAIKPKDWQETVKVGARLLMLLANTIGRIRPEDHEPNMPDNQEAKKYSAWYYLDLDSRSAHFSLEGAEAAKRAPAIDPDSKLVFNDDYTYGIVSSAPKKNPARS